MTRCGALTLFTSRSLGGENGGPVQRAHRIPDDAGIPRSATAHVNGGVRARIPTPGGGPHRGHQRHSGGADEEGCGEDPSRQLQGVERADFDEREEQDESRGRQSHEQRASPRQWQRHQHQDGQAEHERDQGRASSLLEQ